MRSAGFPLLERGYDGAPFVYLDSASTTPKPRPVIDAVARYYETIGANVHRGVHPIAEAATEEFERSRHRVAALIGAQPSEIVFTRNATDSFNLLGRAELAQRANDPTALAFPEIAGGSVGILAAQDVADLRERNAPSGQFFRIYDNLQFVFEATHHVRLGDAADALQSSFDLIFRKTAEFGHVEVGRRQQLAEFGMLLRRPAKT